MSLKEWKNNEINTKLMKKWGLLNEAAKPDFLDLDKDGDKEEPMKDAAKDAKEKDLDEAQLSEDEIEEGGIGQYLRKKLGPEDHSRSGDAHLRHAVTGDYKDPLDPSSTDRLAYEKHPALYADRETLGVKRGEKLPYSKARELFKKSLQKEEEGLEETAAPKMISVHEAKQITRRILERVRKESK